MKEKHSLQQGFTLVEVLIVVAIIAILAAIALPSYQNSVMKSKRSIAAAELLKVFNRQEQYFINNKAYATDLSLLGYASNPYYVSAESQEVGAGDSVYKISLSGASASAFSIIASPQNAQASDSQCADFSITSTGVKGASGAGGVSVCW